MSEIVDTSEKTVLIAASSFDKDTWEPVADNLAGRGYDVIAYEPDKVANGSVPLEIRVNDKMGFSAHYGGRALDLANIGAAWYRRPATFTDDTEPDKALMMSLGSQRSLAQSSLWEGIPERAWLNTPARMRRVEDKMRQLVIAHEVGLTIPTDTVITNRWQPIHEILPPDIISKPTCSSFYRDNEYNIVYTKQLANPTELPTHMNPFPAIFQPYLEKAREWRITVVGDDSFDAAIYTDPSAKDDWRRHQTKPSVEFRSEKFPDKQTEACFRYMAHCGLKFGCFDFTEGTDGTITFLECNTNGQYGWLESALDLPISNAVADTLAKIVHTAK